MEASFRGEVGSLSSTLEPLSLALVTLSSESSLSTRLSAATAVSALSTIASDLFFGLGVDWTAAVAVLGLGMVRSDSRQQPTSSRDQVTHGAFHGNTETLGNVTNIAVSMVQSLYTRVFQLHNIKSKQVTFSVTLSNDNIDNNKNNQVLLVIPILLFHIVRSF